MSEIGYWVLEIGYSVVEIGGVLLEERGFESDEGRSLAGRDSGQGANFDVRADSAEVVAGAGETAMRVTGLLVRIVGFATERNDGFGGTLRQQLEYGQLRGIEFVEAVDRQQAHISSQGRVGFQGQSRQPALSFGVGPPGFDQPGLILAINGGQLGQAGRFVRQRLIERHRRDARPLQLGNQLPQAAQEAGFVAQGRIMRERPPFTQLIDNRAQQAMLHRVVQARLRFPLPGQHLGVNPIKCCRLHADAAALPSQAATKRFCLLLVGRDHPDRSQRVGLLQCLHPLQHVGGFAVSGRSQEELHGRIGRLVGKVITDYFPRR